MSTHTIAWATQRFATATQHCISDFVCSIIKSWLQQTLVIAPSHTCGFAVSPAIYTSVCKVNTNLFVQPTLTAIVLTIKTLETSVLWWATDQCYAVTQKWQQVGSQNKAITLAKQVGNGFIHSSNDIREALLVLSLSILQPIPVAVLPTEVKLPVLKQWCLSSCNLWSTWCDSRWLGPVFVVVVVLERHH
jgi:hypothetical protein